MEDVKILAIDDSKDILYTIKAICDIENWTTITSTNGNEAMDLLHNHNPDLIIVDYHMPKINGIDVVKKLREIDNKTPILILTVEDDHVIAKKFTDAGANDYALKPIKAIDLISRIKVHLRKTKSKKSKYYSYKKGISKNTLDLILNSLRNTNKYLTIDELSEEAGLAYQTVNRYIVYLKENNLIDTVYEYGKKGRPKQKYKIKK